MPGPRALSGNLKFLMIFELYFCILRRRGDGQKRLNHRPKTAKPLMKHGQIANVGSGISQTVFEIFLPQVLRKLQICLQISMLK